MFIRFTRRTGRVAAAGLVALALTAAGGLSSASAQGSKVIAKVGDIEITETDLAYLANENRNATRTQLLNRMIDWAVMAQAAEKEGLDKQDEFKLRMQFLRLNTLSTIYFVKKILPTVTADEINAEYKKAIAGHKAVPQVHARHILVKTEDEAKAIIKELDDGGDFAKLAKEKSVGPSKTRGGDLDYFAKTDMVAPFAEAAFALEKGAHTKAPVKTKFGWHVIKVEDKRDSPPPSLASMARDLRQKLMIEKYKVELKRLRDEAKIEIVKDEAGEKKMDDKKSDADKTDDKKADEKKADETGKSDSTEKKASE